MRIFEVQKYRKNLLQFVLSPPPLCRRRKTEIEMKEQKHLLSYVRRAVDDYHMIEEGDKIAIGVSGGKDSLTLLAALAGLRAFYPQKFELTAVTEDMGFPGSDFSGIASFCETLGIPYHVAPTDIAKIIFDIRKEPNPCSLCAKMRRGALHATAKALGCNKVALGHHFDDAVETFMLNLFFEGRIGCFSPVTYLSRADLTLIRPLLYLPEKAVISYAAAAKLPVTKSLCPADGNTQRESMKLLLRELDRQNKGLKYRIFGAMQRGEIDGFRAISKMTGIKAYADEMPMDDLTTSTEIPNEN